jgi:hypothetical protein
MRVPLLDLKQQSAPIAAALRAPLERAMAALVNIKHVVGIVGTVVNPERQMQVAMKLYF